MPSAALPLRRPQFAFRAAPRAVWTPAAPELGAVADAISLAMPYAEPYVVSCVRNVLDRLEPETARAARAYAAQEAAHHATHRRYNEVIRASVPGVATLERLLDRTFTMLRSTSPEFGAAFTAGFETIAFAAARWVDPRVDRFFEGADPGPRDLFLWHLAEEAEHRSVAYDVMRGLRVRLRTHIAATLLALFLLPFFTFLGTVLVLTHQRRLLLPWVWVRLLIWSCGFLFVALPMAVTSFRRDHHPSHWADPTSLPWWLGRYDETTSSFPDWSSVD